LLIPLCNADWCKDEITIRFDMWHQRGRLGWLEKSGGGEAETGSAGQVPHPTEARNDAKSKTVLMKFLNLEIESFSGVVPDSSASLFLSPPGGFRAGQLDLG
jgi:hypothetical protein